MLRPIARCGAPFALTASVALVWLFAGCRGPDITIAESSSPPAFAGPDAETPTPDVDAGSVLMCPTTQCPAGYATCPGDRFPCAASVATDPYNCGECGRVCVGVSQDQHSELTCKNGQCVQLCAYKYADCDGNPDNGCETNVFEDSMHCGKCGAQCDGRCVLGECGCPDGMADCPAKDGIGNVCTNLSSDNDNCGACGNKCPAHSITITSPNVVEHCVGGACGGIICAPAYADCDGDMAPTTGNGCETRIDTLDNCGACGFKCPSGAIKCASSTGRLECMCAPGETSCAGTCVRLDTDVSNCGACGVNCMNAESSGVAASTGTVAVTCQDGLCHRECKMGHYDCDGDFRNGCETDIHRDPNNCGACGVRCPVPGQPCIDGACATAECPPGTTEAR